MKNKLFVVLGIISVFLTGYISVLGKESIYGIGLLLVVAGFCLFQLIKYEKKMYVLTLFSICIFHLLIYFFKIEIPKEM